jgi:deoxyribodipyrimidine photolyase-related protein
MVTGNFALLIGAHPAEVHRWYLGLFVDGFEWVTAPNTLGMSQWADGGLMATKPYISTAAYIQRMGDYCRGCLYDPKARSGENACPFNALYWDFLRRHKAHLRKNPRMTTALRQLERLGTETQKALQTQAETTLQRADQL